MKVPRATMQTGRGSAIGSGILRGAFAGLAGLAGLALVAFGIAGCEPGSSPLSAGALIVTQVPLQVPGHETGADLLDLSYPPGSRVVLVPNPERSDRVVVLSGRLRAAGAPVLGSEGRAVLFVGKEDMSSAWQVYRADIRGGTPTAVTSIEGGAMAPAWLPAERFVFGSPVPRLSADAAATHSSLFTQSITGGAPARLTFGLVPASDPTVLADGRVLFVSSVPAADGSPTPATSLFTINNDGTEVSPFAGQHDGPAAARRPRETDDGRIVFLSAGAGTPVIEGRIEQVESARPFRSRSVVFPQISAPCRAVEPATDGALLVSLRETGADRELLSYAIYRLAAGATRAAGPLFDDPAWDDVEAVLASRPSRPMGRLSSVDPTRRDATMLCLDAGLWDRPAAAGAAGVAGHRLRVIRQLGPRPGEARILGEATVKADGSVLAQVPSDVPLALELVDPMGQVVRKCPPAFWLRPGENRACVGCHEPHNRAPDNLRPLAVREPPVRLVPGGEDFTQSPPPASP
jgi:hypothetical protein